MKTQKEKAEERRQEKLASIKDQVEQGTLAIRKMTPEEHKAHPPRPRPERSRRR